MSLREKLDARNATNRAHLPAEAIEAMDADTAAVTASKLVEQVADVGDVLPQFALPDATKETVKSPDLLADGPLVVTFYRGGWCPYCNLQFAALKDALPEIHEAGAQLVAVSPMTPDASLSTKEKHELEFTVLSDVGMLYGRELGLVHPLSDDVKALYDSWGFATDVVNDGHGSELPLPATFVVDTDGVIRWRFVDPDYTKRAEPADVIAALRAL